jgi:hypothetical protein
MSEYGTPKYGKGKYGGNSSPSIEFKINVQIYVYDRLGTFKSMYQSGSSSLINVSFSHTEKGCGSFSLEFCSFVDIEKSDKIKIKFLYSEFCFFTGVVRKTPIEGSTAIIYKYTGFGLNDYFIRMNVENITYATKTLSYIVNDIVDDIIVAKSTILKASGEINLPNITVSNFVINYSNVNEVLDAIKKIADSSGTIYTFGVNNNGYFYFKPKESDLKTTLIVGKTGIYGIDNYEPEDSIEPITKVFVLRNDGTLYTTISSLIANDIYEEKIKGPDLSDADLNLWAQGYLAEKELSYRSALIEWKIENSEPLFLIAQGTIRILSAIPPNPIDLSLFAWGNGNWGDNKWNGETYTGFELDDTLTIKQVDYEINDKQAIRKITLGSLPVKMEDIIADTNKKLADLEISLGV